MIWERQRILALRHTEQGLGLVEARVTFETCTNFAITILKWYSCLTVVCDAGDDRHHVIKLSKI